MFTRRNIDRIMLILFCLALLVWCFLGIKALPTLKSQQVQAPTAPPVASITGIAPTSDKGPTPNWITSSTPQEQAPMYVEPTAGGPTQPQFPVPGIELNTMDAASLDLVANAGASWVRRNSLMWSLVEPNEGERNWAAVAPFEQELQEASKRGLQVVLVVSSTPPWAQMVPGSFCGPVSVEKFLSFASFMSDAVKRYSVAPFNIKYWELWNEPDIAPNIVAPDSIYGCWGDETDAYYGGSYYAEMLKQVYPQIKAASSDAQVLVGGLLLDCDPVNPPQGEQCIPARYLEGIMRSGGGDFFDGVSFHAYDHYTGLFEYGNSNWNSNWDSTGPVIIAKARFLRGVLTSYQHPEKYILNTEAGVLCGRAESEAQCQGQEFGMTKASYIAQANVVSLAEALRANIWYSLTGWRGTELIDAQKQPNSAYIAFQFSSSQLRGAAFVRSIADYPGVKGYEFQLEGKKMYVLWSLSKQPQPVLLDKKPDQVFDVLGQVVQPEKALQVSQSPVYVQWSR
jgi:hypothetical protein